MIMEIHWYGHQGSGNFSVIFFQKQSFLVWYCCCSKMTSMVTGSYTCLTLGHMLRWGNFLKGKVRQINGPFPPPFPCHFYQKWSLLVWRCTCNKMMSMVMGSYTCLTPGGHTQRWDILSEGYWKSVYSLMPLWSEINSFGVIIFF